MRRDTVAVTPQDDQRLQVYLAHAGVSSRRASEKLITAGRVSVNGSVISTLGTKVKKTDRICVDNIEVRPETLFHYIALNKPAMYLCSSQDKEGRALAKDLLPLEIRQRLYNIGRLDYLSAGLILFTNDGGFALKLGHPRAEIEKEYIVEATGHFPDMLIESFIIGIIIDDVEYRSKSIERIDRKTAKIILIEGKNREIRKVFSYFHLHPRRLVRVRIGPVLLGDLEEGKTRSLTGIELKKLELYGHSD
jgi:23S rRNA pseudouridine2605 synthase